MAITPFISAEELAKMTPAERIKYRKDRLRSVGAGADLQDTITGQTDDELTARILKQDKQVTPTAGQPTSPVTDELPPGSKVPTEPFGSIDKVEVEPVDIETPENTIENQLIETKVER